MQENELSRLVHARGIRLCGKAELRPLGHVRARPGTPGVREERSPGEPFCSQSFAAALERTGGDVAAGYPVDAEVPEVLSQFAPGRQDDCIDVVDQRDGPNRRLTRCCGKPFARNESSSWAERTPLRKLPRTGRSRLCDR